MSKRQSSLKVFFKSKASKLTSESATFESDEPSVSGNKPCSGRKFQSHWKGLFDWIVYDDAKNIVTCKYCVWAKNQRRLEKRSTLPETQSEVFIKGWCDWKKGTYGLKKHEEKSDVHRKAKEAFLVAHAQSNQCAITEFINKNEKRLTLF
jgi:hypothetical protein